MMTLRLAQLAIARGSRTLLRDIDATFTPGTITALMGANGAGKSSLLATLAGLLPAAAGTVLLDGHDIATLDPRARARSIALVEPAESALASLSVIEAIGGARFPFHRWWEWQPTAADTAAIEAAIAATALTALRDRTLATLSAGERQRVWIALALAQCAPIIALDEPTTHLDLRFANETLALLRRLAAAGSTIITVLHSLEETASFADRVIIVGDGRVLADGAPADAFTAANLQAAYGVAIDVEHGAGGVTFHRKALRPADESAGRER
jgi:ABC-type cobalamin/Fe3+-siderophores transport system ATPase subunit